MDGIVNELMVREGVSLPSDDYDPITTLQPESVRYAFELDASLLRRSGLPVRFHLGVGVYTMLFHVWAVVFVSLQENFA